MFEGDATGSAAAAGTQRYSVIIPAHNEEASIQAGLRAILAAGEPGEQEVIVVCNGCKDRTAEVARMVSDQIRIIETEIASKTHALNLGDQAATAFPRFYVDADVQLSTHALRQMSTALCQGEHLLVSPRMRLDCAGSSWNVRAYYRLWRTTPYVQEGMMGTGVYGLSERGRRRFGKFPDVIADDGYVRLRFNAKERAVVREAESTVHPPTTLAGLIRIKTRSRLGEYQLRQRYPHLFKGDRKDYGGALRQVLGSPQLWPALPVYLFVNLVSRARARRQLALAQSLPWERDESSRTVRA